MRELLQSEEDLTRRGVLKQSVLAGAVTSTGAVGTASGATGPGRHFPATEQTEPTATQTGWTQQTKLVPDDGDEGDLFGFTALSADGTTALIGARFDDNPNGESAGSAYVFNKDGGTWTQQTKLTSDDGGSHDSFGISVSLSGDGTTALIGAPGEEGPDGDNTGAVYVFTEDNETWTQQSKLTPEDGKSYDIFGNPVTLSVDSTIALIGAHRDDTPNGRNAGSVYVFTEDSGTWTQQSKLSPDDGDSRDRFGGSISLSDDGATALIGAMDDEDPNGNSAGSAYIFSKDGGTWTQQSKLIPDDGDSRDHFGYSSLSADGSTAIIGAIRDSNQNGKHSGSAYVFTKESRSWTQQAKLIPDDGDSGDHFGFSSLSADGSTAIIGATGDSNQNEYPSGSAYVFTKGGGTWTQQAKLIPNNESGKFGYPISLSDDDTTVLIGDTRDNYQKRNNPGAAYVFKNNSADTSEAVTTSSSVDPAAPGGDFEITYHLTNVRETAVDGGRLEFTLPSSVELVEVSGDGRSELANSAPSVLYGDSGSISAGETLTTTLQFSVSDSIEPGTVDITATGFLDGAGQVGTRTLSVEIAEGVVARFDTDGDQAIGFRDLLNAIAAYNNNREVGGEPVGLLDLLEVISAYNQ